MEKLEHTELVMRGTAYIEGIARVFEARNYLAIWTAFTAGVVSEAAHQFGLWVQISAALAAGVLAAGLLNRLMRGPSIGDIADVKMTDINFDGPILVVGGVNVMNVGMTYARQRYLKQAVAVEIIPRDVDAKATRANIGQMQAIAHDAAAMVGVYMDVGEQEYTPLVRRDPQSGKLVMVMIPSEDNQEAFLEAVSNVPVLETAIRKPARSVAGRMMDGGS